MYSPRFSGPAVARVHKVDCLAKSAGFDDGNFASLFVNGVNVGSNNRGHNLVVIDEITGNVLNSVSYDTYASSTEANNMATLINGLPNGRIVLVGIKDAGSSSMTENAWLALESLGSAKTRNVGFRDSWAMIGVKGAAIGTVPELYIPRFSGFAEVQQEVPSVYLVDGFHFYYTDHLGSTRTLDDWDPGVTDMEVDYYPFGEDYTVAGGGEGTKYKFTGYEEDSGIGLYYAGARYYDRSIGRWLTVDPLADKYPSLSLYNYVANNPGKLIDSDGKKIINPKGYVLGNPNTAKKLTALDAEVAKITGLKSENFVIEISGGDRYEKDGKVYSSTDDTEIEDSHPKSSHLISRGARGIDLRLPDSKSEITKEDIDKARKNIGIKQHKDDYVKQPHIHLGLPWDQGANSKTYREGYIPFKEGQNKQKENRKAVRDDKKAEKKDDKNKR